MLLHYIKLTFRSLLRNRFHAVINLFGLALGIACSLVILLFVYGEWSYDRRFANGEHIYRIGISFFNMGTFANGPERTLATLAQEFPGVETGTRIRKDRVLMQAGEKYFTEVAYYTDTAFFRLFDFSFREGDPLTALNAPNQLVLTESLAVALFGTADVLGNTVLVGKDKTACAITGVVEDPAFNTHLRTRAWLSNHSLLSGNMVWTSASMHTYVMLREGVTQQDLRDALDRIQSKQVFEESGRPMGFKTSEDFYKSDMAVRFFVHPLHDIYLKSKLFAELLPGGNESNVYLFSGIALFILLLAAVNFVNLTTAHAVRRAKEVGVRKALGTPRKGLVGQFLVESMLTTLIALAFALVLSELFLAAFEFVTGAPLTTTFWTQPWSLPWIVGFALLVGLLSGAYPAFYLTSFKPANVLKGNVESPRSIGFRNYLVVFQFTISTVLIIAAIVVGTQLRYMQTKDLGFDQDNVVTVDNHDVLGTSAEVFKNELANEPGVKYASAHMGEPGSSRVLTFSSYHVPPMEHPISIPTYVGDDSFLPLCGMRLVKGRNFTSSAADSTAIILSEAAVIALGLPEDPIGQKINEKSTVVGVISDLHTESLRNTIRPVAITYSNNPMEISFKLDANAVPGFLKKAEARWKELAPGEVFRYHFLDDNFGEMLKKEAVLGRAVTLFTILAIFISCLGLYGLSAHTAANRTKEIGIRKVLGASSRQIVALLSREFLLLVGIAIVIASPLAWYACSQWLDNFAYRTQLQLWIFVATGASAILVAMIALSYQTFAAANRNPVESLRNE